MATIKTRLNVKNSTGEYDTVHIETSSTMVTHGSTTVGALLANVPRATETVPYTIPAANGTSDNGGWTTNSSYPDYPYEHVFTMEDLLLKDHVDATILPGNEDMAIGCAFSAYTFGEDGKFYLRCKNPPTTELKMEAQIVVASQSDDDSETAGTRTVSIGHLFGAGSTSSGEGGTVGPGSKTPYLFSLTIKKDDWTDISASSHPELDDSDAQYVNNATSPNLTLGDCYYVMCNSITVGNAWNEAVKKYGIKITGRLFQYGYDDDVSPANEVSTYADFGPNPPFPGDLTPGGSDDSSDTKDRNVYMQITAITKPIEDLVVMFNRMYDIDGLEVKSINLT